MKVFQRKFVNYSEQRNWAIDNIETGEEWQLHLDADEIMSGGLIEEIRKELHSGDKYDGYFIPRKTRFLGRDLVHGGYFPIYHMRLFRTGRGRVETKLYDQHFILTGQGKRLRGYFIDDHQMSLSEWIIRHNRWSDLEAREMLGVESAIQHGSEAELVGPSVLGNVLERKRARKALYLSLPRFSRAFGLFIYRYVFRMGFLDGIPGLIYCVLQAFWFRFVIDAKCYEARTKI